MATVTLRISPQRAHVRTARLVAAAMARRSGVQEDILDEIRLAVGEACARAVRLHERHSVPEPVVIELTDGPRFEVVVCDLAPSAVGTASPADRPQQTEGTGHAPVPAAHSRTGGEVGSGGIGGGESGGGSKEARGGEDGSGGTGGDEGGGASGGIGGGGDGSEAAGGGGASGGQPTAAERTDGAAVGGAWVQPLDSGIGLALLDALVDSIVIEPTYPGTRVRMRWSLT
jgi:hypothetical protein